MHWIVSWGTLIFRAHPCRRAAAYDLFPIVAEFSEFSGAMEASALEAGSQPTHWRRCQAAAARARLPPERASAGLQYKAGDRVVAYYLLAERMAEGEVSVVLADRGEVRVSFNLRDDPPTFYSIIGSDTTTSTGAFWQGDPGC